MKYDFLSNRFHYLIIGLRNLEATTETIKHETVFLFVRMSCDSGGRGGGFGPDVMSRPAPTKKQENQKKNTISDGFDASDTVFLQFSMVFGEGVRGGGGAGVAPE